MAVVLTLADNFWVISARNAVGAVERIQEPFTSYWRESTVVLPLFVLAVLGALTLALRQFGQSLRGPKPVSVAALMIVVAATAVAIAQIAVSAVEDYRLQSDQLIMMGIMHGVCTGTCLVQAQHATLLAHLRAIGYVGGLLLATNLVVVSWMVMMWGGRLRVSRAEEMPAGQAAASVTASRVGVLRLALVAGLVGSGAIHAAVIPKHLSEWPAAGVFFVLLTAAEVAVAAIILVRTHRNMLLAAAAVSMGPLLIWLCSRTVGMPFGPEAGTPEGVGVPDVVAGVLEVSTLMVALLLLGAVAWVRRPAPSAHGRALVAVALVAVTAIGLAGTAPSWIDATGDSGGHSELVDHPH
ncbi:MAG TPA: hypothetical protein VFJ97_10595 [Dermatophilaceae bacterium]|nr:hypothetical protein [Dermatophilaceae bacterium]